jgi:putative radical SAM enzyme (TIGR03279 family)
VFFFIRVKNSRALRLCRKKDFSLSHDHPGGLIAALEPKSFAAELKLRIGDEVLEVNGHSVEDVIDVQYYAADEWVELKIRRGEASLVLEGPRDYNLPLGIEFEHPTFDIDIRRCNNLCSFCFVLQMPNRMRRALYIKDDDYRYSFLHGHFVTLTNLSPHDWDRIVEQHLSPLYVSVHATDLEVRRKLLRNPSAPDILEQLNWLRDHDIEVHTQLVVTPGLNDGKYLSQSIHELAKFWPTVQSVSVVPVGITKAHKYHERPCTLEETRAIVDEVHGYQVEFKKKFGKRFAYLTDEWYLVLGEKVPPKSYYDGLSLEENGQGMVRNFLDDWREVKKEVSSFKLKVSGDKTRHALRGTHHAPRNTKYKSATLVTGTLFAPTLAQAAKQFTRISGWPLEVIPIVNDRLGATITVAGLLMGEDVIAQLKERELGKVLVLPRIMFDHPQGISLDDKSVLDIARVLDRPIALADAMGDVLDALTGHNRLMVKPTDQFIPPDVMKAGGWAVEKYL